MTLISISSIQLNSKSIEPSNLKDKGTVLLFLHEALGSIGQWKSFPQELCNKLGLRGIVYERQGYGQSSPLSETRGNDYLHRYALDELPKFIDAAIPKEVNLILVGHSDGGTIALLYAKQYPKRVVGMITMAAHVIVEPITLAGIDPAIKAYEQGKLDGLKKYHGDKTNDLFFAWANTWKSEVFKNWNICKEIEGIKIPALILQGEDDQYGTAKQVELIAGAFQNKVQTAIIPNCGHHPHLEKQYETIDLIEKWYAKKRS